MAVPAQKHTYKKGAASVGRSIWDRDTSAGVEYEMAFIDVENRCESLASISYRNVAGVTEVTWAMKGDVSVPVIGGYLTLMMKPQIKGSFQDGLAHLKGALKK